MSARRTKSALVGMMLAAMIMVSHRAFAQGNGLSTVANAVTKSGNIVVSESDVVDDGDTAITTRSDQVTEYRDYSDLPTFEYNGQTYVVAPDPQQSFSEYIGYNAAYSYCENLTLYGYSDWRMPTIEELEMMYLNRFSIGGFVEGNGNYEWMLYHSSTYGNSSVGHIKLLWVNGSRIGDANLEVYGFLNYNNSGTIYYCRAHVRPIRVHLELPTVTTNTVTDITPNYALCGGNVTNDGGAEVTTRGVCWSTNHNPTISDSYYSSGYGTGSYLVGITNLTPGTQYYARAYATNSEGTSYGNEVSFTTTSPPTVATNNVTNIAPNSAICGGNVTSEGSATVTARGICWSTGHNPNIYSSHTNDGTGMGSYTSNITGLNPETQYYVRAYATNSEGTSYGEEVSFTTTKWLDVTTSDVTYITQTSANCGGYVTAYNGATVTARGVCWSTTNQNPTISGSHTTEGTGAGGFTSSLIGLSQNTTYYVRAYATCSGGTVYGETKQFKTTKLSYRISEGGVVATSAGGYFYDSGGPNGWYNNNEHYIMTFMSNQGAGTKIRMTFTEFGTMYNEDYLIIYDGMNTSAPLIGTYSGHNAYSPGTVTASNSDGALTFVFISDNGYTSDGWKAAISIVTPSNTISVSANPSNGGAVTGGGYYNTGEMCTLTATPASGYQFVNWKKDGNVVSTSATYTFTVNNSGSYVAHFTQTGGNVTQTTNFTNGWNWWSGYVELNGASSLQSLENGLGTHGVMVKSQNNGYASYLSGYGWYGSLTAINNECTYQVKTNAACTVSLSGNAANPASHPVTLTSGWTWVGYPVNASMSVTTALAGITPQSGDMLKSQNNGYASYLSGYGWYGSLNTLNPGMGLMYKSNRSSSITLTYPNGGSKEELKANQTTENNHWQPNLNAYPDNMNVMAVVELDGNELQGENYELAAFANGEVRGSARLLYVEPLNRYIAFLTVAGDEPAELTFGLYDTETGAVETQCLASLQYETNAVVGSFAEPYVVRFRSTTGVNDWASSLQIFPNPVERGQTISLGFADEERGEVRVEIVNALGMVETTCTPSQQTIVAPKVAGVYILRITTGMGTCYRRLIVR
ncbi:MAG: T9SS type A sorting domain-containing protein [Bacteroidales bacterium]|nr:T9SS type A sorting domain-containing protein [Bacteroidales bacterium]